MNKIGDIIREYRIKNNLTQEELGAKLFLSKQAVSKWENGRSLPDLETTKKLVDILGIDSKEIFETEQNESISSSRKKKKIPLIVLSAVLCTAVAVASGILIYNNVIKSDIQLGIGKPVMPRENEYFEQIIISYADDEFNDKERACVEEIRALNDEYREDIKEVVNNGWKYHIEAEIVVDGFETTVGYRGNIQKDNGFPEEYYKYKTLKFIPDKYDK